MHKHSQSTSQQDVLFFILYEEGAHLGQHGMEVICLLVLLQSLGEELIVLLAQGVLHCGDVKRGPRLLGLRRLRSALLLQGRKRPSLGKTSTRGVNFR